MGLSHSSTQEDDGYDSHVCSIVIYSNLDTSQFFPCFKKALRFPILVARDEVEAGRALRDTLEKGSSLGCLKHESWRFINPWHNCPAKWNAAASLLAGHPMEITYQAQSARKAVTRNISLSGLTALFLYLSAACLEDIILNDLPFPQQYEISVQNLFARGCLHRHFCLAVGNNTSVHRLAYLPLRASSMTATKDLFLICLTQFSVTAS